jgi:hypothetical protein
LPHSAISAETGVITRFRRPPWSRSTQGAMRC